MTRPLARVLAGLLAIGLAVGACAPAAEDTPHGAGDSTAAPATATDSSIAGSTAGTERRSDSLSVKTQSMVIAPLERRDSIIGRDSAFGPIGTIDSKGKLVPIKKP